MNHDKKSKLIIAFSGVLAGLVVFGAVYLGAGVGVHKDAAPRPGNSKYDLYEISKYKTPYTGDNSKVSAIVRCLPMPDSYFMQQYISMKTDSKPYKLNVYYEAKKGASHSNEWPVTDPDSAAYSNSRKNALVLFCMIDNLDEVTFAFRDSQSDGKLDETKYDTSFNFSRASIEERYGDLSVLSGDLKLLQNALTEITGDIKESKQKISAEERKRMDLYIEVMKGAFQQENGGSGFVAVDLDTLTGLGGEAREEVLKELDSLSFNVYSFKDVKNDKSKFELDDNGNMVRSIYGTLLWVQVEKYSESKAVITGVSWFGNLGAVFPQYEAVYKNGKWQLKLIGIAIS